MPRLGIRALTGTLPRRFETVMAMTSQTATKLTVYHDGSCPLCRREIAMYRRQPGAEHLAFVDVADDASVVGPGLDRCSARARFHVRLPDGRLVSGAAGFVAIWRRLRGWRWLARLAGLPGATAVLEAGYHASLSVRPRLARFLGRFAAP